MLDLSNLTKTREQREIKSHLDTANKVAKEMFLELIGKQLTYQETKVVIQMMFETLDSWGKLWLDNKFVNHIKNDLEDQGKLI
jgi:hypothetical protein